LSAGYRYFDALSDSGNLGRGYGRQSIVLGLLAGFAAFRFVLKTFVVKEDLLAHSPSKWLIAVDARNGSVLKVSRPIVRDSLRPVI
jgi:hypothetical protein